MFLFYLGMVRHNTAINPTQGGPTVFFRGPKYDTVRPGGLFPIFSGLQDTSLDDGELNHGIEVVVCRVLTLLGEGKLVAIAVHVGVHALGGVLPIGLTFFQVTYCV